MILVCELTGCERVWCIDWHHCGNLLASVGESKLIRLWAKNEQQGWSLASTVETEHTKTIRRVRFSHCGQKIAACSFDSTVSIYMRNEGNYEALTILQGHQSQVKCIDWSLDDKKIASCSRDKNVWIWGFNPETYEYECEHILEGHIEDVKYVKWLNASTLASTSYDNTIRIWGQDDDDYVILQVLEGHTSIVWSLAYDPFAKKMYTVSEDTTIIVWKQDEVSEKFQLQQTVSELHLRAIYSCCLLSSNWLVTGSGDDTMALLNLNQQAKEIVHDRKHHNADINCVSAIHIDKQKQWLLASCSDDETIKIWYVDDDALS